MEFSDFRSAVEALHPFYSLLGEAAATLLGLLFVAVTFNPQILESSKGPVHRRDAENIFRQFVFLVWLSLAMLLPMNPTNLGGNLLAQSIAFLVWIFFGFCSSLRTPRVSRGRTWWRGYLINFTIYLGAAWAGCIILGWGPDILDAIGLLVTISFLSLLSGLYGVWRLMVGSRAIKLVASQAESAQGTN